MDYTDEEYEKMFALVTEVKYDEVFRYAVITLHPLGPTISDLMTAEDALEERRLQSVEGKTCFLVEVTPICTEKVRPPRPPLEIKR